MRRRMEQCSASLDAPAAHRSAGAPTSASRPRADRRIPVHGRSHPRICSSCLDAALLRCAPPLPTHSLRMPRPAAPRARTNECRAMHLACTARMHAPTHAFRYIDCHIPNRTQPGHCTRAAHHHRTGDSRMVSRLVRLVVIVHVLKVQNARLMHARRTRASARVASLPPPPPHARPVIQPVGRRRAPHHPCRWLARCRRRCADSG